MHHYNFLIAGSGLAGLYAAHIASKYGKVAIVTKHDVSDSNTYYAQGGIASVIDIEDSPTLHYQDTITAGRGLSNQEAVNVLVNESPLRIKELIEEGMHFDKLENGKLALGLEGGHCKRRVLYAGGDITGQHLSLFMTKQILNNPNITLFEDREALELILERGRVGGLRVWNSTTSKEEQFYSDTTILALGGASALYSRTTNPNSSLGNGVAICYQAGCQIVDIEFIQFHPTSLYHKSGETHLVSEAVRGEGAHLINSKGERFMVPLHPLAELAPRDVVSQAIDREIKAVGGKPPYVYLSLSHLNREEVITRFPNINQKCHQLGIDMADKIPVAPAAHYMVGGVKCDLNGKTDIEGLYICGELASTGVMGANRLASNSLAECLVFGYRAVMSAKERLTQLPGEQKKGKKQRNELNNQEPKFYVEPKNRALYLETKLRVAEILGNYCGIVRNEEGLLQALKELDELRSSENSNEYYSYTAHNLITVAELIAKGALHRTESRGGHFRKEWPEENPNKLYHTIQRLNKNLHLKDET